MPALSRHQRHVVDQPVYRLVEGGLQCLPPRAIAPRVRQRLLSLDAPPAQLGAVLRSVDRPQMDDTVSDGSACTRRKQGS